MPTSERHPRESEDQSGLLDSRFRGNDKRFSTPPPAKLPLARLRPLVVGSQICQDVSAACRKEWLIANEVGGFASSTILGMNTRRYHGLLVAATQPPVGRVVLLSQLEETLVSQRERHLLSTHRYAGIIHPEGYRNLVEFRLDPWPTFFYRIGQILLEKSVFLLPGENAVVVGYTLHAAPGPLELIIRPLVAFRDFRWLSKENSQFNAKVQESPGTVTLQPYPDLPPLTIHHTAELVDHSPCWYKNFEYVHEQAEGVSCQEDLWSPGQLVYLLKVGESSAFVGSTGRRGNAEVVFHERRVENTQKVLSQNLTPPGHGPLATRLAWTAQSFLALRQGSGQAHRPTEAFLMAGFPWLSCWGRDALIALPGLFLATQRLDVARTILETMISHLKGGLFPVRFAEEDGSPEYDSADTSLWFFWAVWHYYQATRNIRFVAKKLLPAMREVMEAYLEGTSFGIRMDEDGLILLSDEELPLTWMDAREPGLKLDLPGRAVTPRHGKPVEVNALWYCALSIMGHLSDRLGLQRASTYLRLSRLVEAAFRRTFTNPQGYLYDRVTGNFQDPAIRPNMLIAASLPFSPISKEEAAQIVAVTERHLVTPMGLRTLSPHHPQYRGRWEGDLKARALAFHQGTVWSWLVGPYVSTRLKVQGHTRPVARSLKKQLEPFLSHLEEGCLGSISEIFDGDTPHAPRGGFSQAWSVGELLRVIEEAKLSDL